MAANGAEATAKLFTDRGYKVFGGSLSSTKNEFLTKELKIYLM